MPKPIPKYEDIYGSEYVSPEDFDGGKQVKVRILSYEILELTCVKGGRAMKNVKCVLTCEGCKKKVAVNKTSAKRLAMAWGKDFVAWIGKTITVMGGEVNSRPAILLAPVADGAMPIPPIGLTNASDDLAFDESSIRGDER